MIRRLILLSLAVYAVVALSKAGSKRTKDQNDSQAHADWESEGGNPPPEPIHEPVTA